MELEQAVKSKKIKLGAALLIGALILIIVFAAGVFVGLEKAKFSYRWGENYFRNFAGGPRGGPGQFFPDRNYFNPHGSDGQIIKIEATTVIIKDETGTEKNIIVAADTAIRKDRIDLKLDDLKINDNIVVIGSPDDKGQIQAKLIRVIPSPLP